MLEAATPAPHIDHEPFTKRKYTLNWLASDSLQVLPRVGDIYSIAVHNRLSESFREEIMVAVSRANGCTICNFTHHDFAQLAGVTLERLHSLERGDHSGFEPERQIALEYAVALSLSGFGTVDPGLKASFDAAFEPGERMDIELVTRFITIMNLSCNKLETFFERMQGRPAIDSLVVDELVISSVALAIIPVMYGLVARVRREPFYKVCLDFIDFAREYEASRQPSSIDVPQGQLNHSESHSRRSA